MREGGVAWQTAERDQIEMESQPTKVSYLLCRGSLSSSGRSVAIGCFSHPHNRVRSDVEMFAVDGFYWHSLGQCKTE